jgi:hypothetical protein
MGNLERCSEDWKWCDDEQRLHVFLISAIVNLRYSKKNRPLGGLQYAFIQLFILGNQAVREFRNFPKAFIR